jgi:membrane protein required for colicin V production
VNWLDYLLVLILAVSLIQGVARGFSREIIGLAAVVLGILLGIWFYGSAGALFLPYVASPAIAKFLGFLIIFAGMQILGALAGFAAQKFFKAAGLGWLDRLLGFCFGALKALLIATALVLVLTAFPVKPLPDSVSNSRFAPHFLSAAQMLTYLAPRDLRDGFVRTYEKLREFWIKQHPGSGKNLPTTQV